jgi:vancomycin resistance protein YoaR
MERTDRAPWHERRWVRVVALALASVLLLYVGDSLLHLKRVVRGVWVSGASLSGSSREDAERVLHELEERLARAPLRVRIGQNLHEIDPSALGFSVDVAASADLAFACGRRGVLADFGFWLARFVTPAHFRAVVVIDDERARRLIEEWESEGKDARPFGGGVKVEGDDVRGEPPRRGVVIDRAAALALLRASLAEQPRSTVSLPEVEVEPFVVPGAVEAAVERARQITRRAIVLATDSEDVTLTVSSAELKAALRSREPSQESPRIELYFDPAAIDQVLAKTRSAIEDPPREASFLIDDRDRVSVIPSRSGTLLSAERVAGALLSAAGKDARGSLPLERGTEPVFTTKVAEALKITGLVAQHTTHHVCCQPRVENIHRAADLVDSLVVEPGSFVSLNAILGPRTAKNGFLEAPTIEEGEMVDSLGGGVSQFATTFFNALFLGGYQIEERTAHTFWFSRYPMGRDATLSWPKPDVIFQNDSNAGILIRALYTDTSITVKLYGDNGGRKVRFRVSPQQDLVKPPIEYIADPERTPDEEKVKESGQMGWTVFVTRDIEFPNGEKLQDRRKVIYKPRVRRLLVHECRIPEGEPGYTGEKCPEPEDAGADAE